MNWNNTAYTEIVAKHAVLDGKPESVALAVWALTQNKDMTPEGWRELSAKTGVKVAGRAVGSARAILGLQPARTPAKPKSTKPGPGRPKGSKNKRSPSRPRSTTGGLDPVNDLVATITNLQEERDRAVAVIEKVRRCLHELG